MKILVGWQGWRALRAAGIAVVLLYPGVVTASDPPSAAQSGPTREAVLEQLVRGTSTRADVERLLGHASGIGGSRLPPDWQTREVWFYDSIKAGKMTAEPPSRDQTRTIHVDLAQDILLVFFAGDLFDGYMWYATAGVAHARYTCPPGFSHESRRGQPICVPP